MATQTGTRIHAKQALTAQGWQQNVTVQADQAGVITAVEDETSAATGDYQTDILLPALANLHSHSFQRAMAGLAERRSDASADDFWTWRSTMYRFLELLTPDDLESIAAQVHMEMLESGYASCGEFHYIHHDVGGKRYADPIETSIRQVSAAQTTGIGLTHLPVLYQQGGLDQRPLEGGQLRFGCSLQEFSDMHARLSGVFNNQAPSDFVLGVAPHSLRAVNHEGLQLAEALCPHQPIHIHIAEQTREVEEVSAALGATPVAWLLEECHVDQRWCLVHATHMSDQETERLAKSKAVAGLCPITEANLGDGIFNAPNYIQHAGRFGIGSDSNVLISLTEELRTLEYSQRLLRQQRLVMTSDENQSNGGYLYGAAASGGAQALGRNSGSLAVGQLADLVALDGEHVALQGKHCEQLLDAWIFAARNNAITDVWSAGRHRVRDGHHVAREDIEQKFVNVLQRLQSKL